MTLMVSLQDPMTTILIVVLKVNFMMDGEKTLVIVTTIIPMVMMILNNFAPS